jgi:hypothetical protein
MDERLGHEKEETTRLWGPSYIPIRALHQNTFIAELIVSKFTNHGLSEWKK